MTVLDWINTYSQFFNMVNAFSVTAAMGITIISIFFDTGILKQSKNQQEIEFIQRRLELLYYPLKHSMFRNYEIAYAGWCDREPSLDTVGSDPYDEPFDSDSELDKIFDDMLKDYKEYYKYSYLGSDKLQHKLIEMQDWLYPDNEAIAGWFELRRETYTADRFFNLCKEINKTVDADIRKYKDKLYKLVNSECPYIQNDIH